MLCGLSYLAAALAGLYAFVTLMNLAVFRRPPRPRADARPAVSLLIPARDEAANIDGALKAALAGNGVDLEVIVLDDGSSDGTDAKVRAWAARDGRVRLVGARTFRAAGTESSTPAGNSPETPGTT